MKGSYEALAKKLVQRALKQGAQQAEAFLSAGRESSCRVRDGEIEDLTEATSKGVGLRVFVKGRLGFAFTSDFDPSSINAFVDQALRLAEAAAPNPLNGLPTRNELKTRVKLEGLFDAEVAALAPDWKVKAALEMERAGKDYDPRVSTFESVGAGENVVEVVVASSEGLLDGYAGTYVYLQASPVASDRGQLQTSYWVDVKRYLRELDSPESVGREAARRAVRMLGAKKIPSARVPVVFDPQMAAGFVRSVAGAASGDAVYKKSSFLAALKGERIAPSSVTLVDDGLLPGGIATAPFDGEGVPTRSTPIIDRGVLTNFLYDAFTARKAKARSTGNASRGYDSLPGIGSHNLYLKAGDRVPEAIIAGVKSGLYVTAMLGRGMNPVSGEYSRGANGLWIENGELAYPVQEVTVAGNALEMLQGIDAIGNDLEFRGSTAAPTLRFAEMTVSGA
ncbi:MAG TPA: TldD/PmbA family protein [Myxococcaceae bacterium]|nr:TldD/PmbA family protein [Myxococcaceae bacterium]